MKAKVEEEQGVFLYCIALKRVAVCFAFVQTDDKLKYSWTR